MKTNSLEFNFKKINSQEFLSICDKHFHFLIDEHRFSYIDSGHEFRVLLQNTTTQLSIHYLTENLPAIHLKSLTGPYQGKVIELGLLIFIKAPQLNPLKDETDLPLKKDFDTFMKEYANALKQVGLLLLLGDFSVYDEVEVEREKYATLRASGIEPSVYF